MPEVKLIQFIIICPLLFIAGFIDSIAGGGGLISLPAYMISGLPVHLAIGTNKMSSFMGTSISTIKYARNGYIPWKLAVFCVPCALLGSAIGANLSLLFSEEYFKIFMLIALPLIAVYVMRGKALRDDLEQYSFARMLLISVAAAFIIGIYDGFYGPGTGTFLILVLNSLAHMDVRHANGLTKAINLSTNISALTVFLTNMSLVPVLGIAAGLFNMAGNYVGSTYFSKSGAKSARPVLITVLVIFFIKIIYEFIAG